MTKNSDHAQGNAEGIPEGLPSAWDANALLYDEVQGETGDTAHEIIYDPEISQLLGDTTGKRVLDAGCGNGCWTRRLAKQAKSVTGVDSSTELIKLARAKANPENVQYSAHDLTERLTFEDESFELVLSSMVLHYLPSLDITIAEFSRVLASNGEAIVCVQHPMYQYHYRAQARAGKESSIFPRTIGYFDRGSLKQITLFGKIEVPTYNRTLEEYVRIFSTNSFVLTDLREPQFTEEFLEVMPRYREVSEVPRVIIMKFRKLPAQKD